MLKPLLLSILLTTSLLSNGQQLELLTPLHDDIHESSGLIYLEGRLITHNDSGGEPKLYEVDTLTGNVTREVMIQNATNKDWEDICHDETYIYIGDFGNNNNHRTDLKIYRIAKEDYLNHDTVEADIIAFNYQDQTDFTYVHQYNATYDAEAMISLRDSLYIFTKNWVNNHTAVYPISKTPNHPVEAALTKIDSWNAQGLITGADICQETGQILLIGYTPIYPFVVSISNYTGSAFFQGNVQRMLLQVPTGYSCQIEGVAAISPDLFYVSAESFQNTNAALYKLDFNTTSITKIENDAPLIYPNPTSDYFEISSPEPLRIEIYNAIGQKLKTTSAKKVDIRNFPVGTYHVEIFGQNHQFLSSQKLTIHR